MDTNEPLLDQTTVPFVPSFQLFRCFGEKKNESAAAPRLPPQRPGGWHGVGCELRIRMGGSGSVQFRYLDLFKVFFFRILPW